MRWAEELETTSVKDFAIMIADKLEIAVEDVNQ